MEIQALDKQSGEGGMAQTFISFPLGSTRVFLKVAGNDNFAAAFEYLLRWELMTSYKKQQE